MSDLEIRILKMIRTNLKSALESDYSMDYRSATNLSLDLLALLVGDEDEEEKGEETNE